MTLAVAHAVALVVPPVAVDAASPIVWLEDGNVRILEDDPAGSAQTIELYAARGEYEPFQVVVRGPSGGLSNVELAVSDLRGSAGAIAKDHITFYREHYIRDSGTPDLGPNKGEGEGWYPEPLIPFVHPETGDELSGARFDAVPFDVGAGKNQPIWVDIFVPRNTSAGRYTSTVTVSSDQGSVSVDVVLNIWNFELPLRLSMKGEAGLLNDRSKAAAVELLRHGIAIRHLPDLQWQDEFVEEHGMQTSNAGFWTGLSLSECRDGNPGMPSPPSVSEVRGKVNQFRDDILVYAYFADEIGRCLGQPGFPEAVKRYAKALQDGGATPLLTVLPRDSIWIPGSYIWPVSIHAFKEENRAEIQRVLDAPEQEMWTYHVLYHDGVSPKWFIDYPPINLRMHAGFMSQQLGITGFLFWRVDNWRSESKSWTETKFHGDGHFVYAGSEVGVPGVIGGMRLKYVREGFEDYEYVTLLKNAGFEDWALDKVRGIVQSNSDWTKDMNELRAVRKELGDKLHEIGGGEPDSRPCHLLDRSRRVPAGFGASYDIISSSRELLLKATCTNTEVVLKIGNGTDIQYIYEQGYEFRNDRWHRFQYTGSDKVGAWLLGEATATRSRTTEEMGQPNFFVAYVCTWTGIEWKCGCRDQGCATNYWQLQAFRAPTPPAPDEPPPTVTDGSL